MAARLVALDEGSDIVLDRAMVVVGRHPQCDARLDSLRVSRHHCCMTNDHGEVVVRDLGSTNGIRINGQRVEMGRLKAGDELSIAHIRYRLDNGEGHEATMADPVSVGISRERERIEVPMELPHGGQYLPGERVVAEQNLAEKVRGALAAAGVGDRCHIKVIVQMPDDAQDEENAEECPPDSSH